MRHTVPYLKNLNANVKGIALSCAELGAMARPALVSLLVLAAGHKNNKGALRPPLLRAFV